MIKHFSNKDRVASKSMIEDKKEQNKILNRLTKPTIQNKHDKISPRLVNI